MCKQYFQSTFPGFQLNSIFHDFDLMSNNILTFNVNMYLVRDMFVNYHRKYSIEYLLVGLESPAGQYSLAWDLCVWCVASEGTEQLQWDLSGGTVPQLHAVHSSSLACSVSATTVILIIKPTSYNISNCYFK